MVASRNRPKGVRRYGPFGLSVLVLSLMPTQIGYQDLAALWRASRRPRSARARQMLASPFGTIHAATFSFPRPIGTLIPEPPRYQLASLRPRSDVTGSIGARLRRRDAAAPAAARFSDRQPPAQGRSPGVAPARRPAGRRHARSDARPGEDRVVSRARRGRRASRRGRAAPASRSGSRQLAADSTPFAPDSCALPRAAEPPPIEPSRDRGAAPEAKPEPQRHCGRAADQVAVTWPRRDRTPLRPGAAERPRRCRVAVLLDPIDDANPAVRLGRLYFGNNPVGEAVGTDRALARGRGAADRWRRRRPIPTSSARR